MEVKRRLDQKSGLKQKKVNLRVAVVRPAFWTARDKDRRRSMSQTLVCGVKALRRLLEEHHPYIVCL